MTQEQIPEEYEKAMRDYIGDDATLQTFKTFKIEGNVYKVIALYSDFDSWKDDDIYYVVCAFSLGSDIAVSVDASDTNDVKVITEALLRRM